MGKIKKGGKTKKLQWSLDPLLVGYAAIILAILLTGAKLFLHQARIEGTVNENTYQAVFLLNGQVLFGQYDLLDRQTAELQDTYFLQQGTAEDGDNTELRVVAAEDDLHKPSSTVVLNRSQILYWENLQLDSPIIEAIGADKHN